ncbi:MAG: WecB/TagA/CpsF family glycosyltransferase [Bryobacteraceae bacterium]
MTSGITHDRIYAAPKPRFVRVLGAPLHLLSLDEILETMERWIATRDVPRWIAVTGAHGIVESNKSPEFKRILESADLSIPDGRWTVWFAQWRARSRMEQIRGADLLQRFCETAAVKGYRVYFYGDTPEVLEALCARLRALYPKLLIAGAYSPPFRDLTPGEEAEIRLRIVEARPDVLFAGLGLPKQERWIAGYREKLDIPVMVAIGAAFKFVSGLVKPAPRAVSAAGLEWLWRFLHEPRRCWRRVVVHCPWFLANCLLEIVGVKKYQ